MIIKRKEVWINSSLPNEYSKSCQGIIQLQCNLECCETHVNLTKLACLPLLEGGVALTCNQSQVDVGNCIRNCDVIVCESVTLIR